jgi:hypothetical protein
MIVKGANDFVFVLSPKTVSERLLSAWRAGQISFGPGSLQWKALNVLFIVRDFLQAAGSDRVALLDILTTRERSQRCDRVVKKKYGGLLCIPPLEVETCEIDALTWSDALKVLLFGRLTDRPRYVTVDHVGLFAFIDGVWKWVTTAPEGIVKCGENILALKDCLEDAWSRRDAKRANECLGLLPAVTTPPPDSGPGTGPGSSPGTDGGSGLLQQICNALKALGLEPKIAACGVEFSCEQAASAISRGEIALSLDGRCPQGFARFCSVDTPIGAVTVCRKQPAGFRLDPALIALLVGLTVFIIVRK